MRFEDKLKTLALRFDLSVTSWGRTTARNRAVGGVINSLHLMWLAADVVLDDPAGANLFVSEAKKLGLWTLIEDDHIHIEQRS